MEFCSYGCNLFGFDHVHSAMYMALTQSFILPISKVSIDTDQTVPKLNYRHTRFYVVE